MLLQPDQSAPGPKKKRGKDIAFWTVGGLVIIALSFWLKSGNGMNGNASASAPSTAACSAIEAGWSSFESVSKPAEKSHSWDALYNAENAFAKIAGSSGSNPLVIKLEADLILLDTDIVTVEGSDSGIPFASPSTDAGDIDVANTRVAADEQAIASACG